MRVLHPYPSLSTAPQWTGCREAPEGAISHPLTGEHRLSMTDECSPSKKAGRGDWGGCSAEEKQDVLVLLFRPRGTVVERKTAIFGP